MTISECLQLVYHKSLKNHVILLYPRDILLIDLHINMTVGVISIDKSSSPLMQVKTLVSFALTILKILYLRKLKNICRLFHVNNEICCFVFTNLAVLVFVFAEEVIQHFLWLLRLTLH